MFKTERMMISCKPLYNLSLYDIYSLSQDEEIEGFTKGINYLEVEEEAM